MKPTEVLKQEHRIIERVLDALDKAVHRMRGENTPHPDLFLKAVDFIRGYADGCHHQKEEGALFPAMIEAGISNEGGPIGVMLAEHEKGREFTRGMKAAAEQITAGRAEAKADLVENALQYVALLRQHILKEDEVLFPMADRAVTGPGLDKLSAAFERLGREEAEAQVHERFMALVEIIERGAAA
jgi:hemerythrin-like domain-containing protein